MNFSILEPASFLSSGMFRQDEFLDQLDKYDWNQLADKKVLVRGCGDIITPPWAYMAIAARLVGVARSVRYGNEHDHVVIYRMNRKEKADAPD